MGTRRTTSDLSLLEVDDSEDAHQNPAMKERVALLEKEIADLKSKMSTLENAVMGNAFSLKASLLQTGELGSSLKSRIMSLEEEVDSLRNRVSSLEHTVVG